MLESHEKLVILICVVASFFGTAADDVQDRCVTSNPCSQKCVDTGNNVECSCYPGYRLRTDRYACEDIDECVERLDNCDPDYEICVNLYGSYRCHLRPNPQCPAGFRWNGNSAMCEDIDECRKDYGSCQLGAVCANTPGSFHCILQAQPVCPPGYKPASPVTRAVQSCIDVNECVENLHTCNLKVEECVNDIGNYQCIRKIPTTVACPPGYEYNQNVGKCTDIDECFSGEHTCAPPLQVCYNTEGSYRCVLPCPPGFLPDTENPSQCRDLDECEKGMDDCNPLYETCINTNGSYNCHSLQAGHVSRVQCPPGYRLNLTTRACEDIDECEEATHHCALYNQRCVNVAGSHQCYLIQEERCTAGFQFNTTSRSCVDIDECTEDKYSCISQSEICVNTYGSYQCEKKPSCALGFTLDPPGKTCVDINECTAQQNICGRNQRCINTFGSYRCHNLVKCHSGFELDETGGQCVDVDECAQQINDCGASQICRNTAGSYMCECPVGYAMTSLRHCEDIDECLRYQVCLPNALCQNTPGSYLCYCREGFKQLEGRTQCVDTDECADVPLLCQHKCINIWGSYMCKCDPGYVLWSDKRSCQDIDECTISEGKGRLCVGNCVNTPGSYFCSCPHGYRLAGDGKTCQDINECQEQHVCQGQDETCINTFGSYKCKVFSCPHNYSQDRRRLSSSNKAPTVLCKKRCYSDDINCVLNNTQTIAYQTIALPTLHQLPAPLVLTTMRPIIRRRRAQIDITYEILDGNELNYFDILRGNNIASVRLIKPVVGPLELQVKVHMVVKLRHSRQFPSPSIRHVAFIYVTVSPYDF